MATATDAGHPSPSDAEPAPSLGELVRDASTQLSTLLRSEVELAKLELRSEVKKAVTGSMFFIIALVVFLLSLPFIFVTLAEVLIAIGLPRWSGYAIITLLFFVLAGLFGYLGFRKMRRIRAPQRTIEEAKGTVAALTHRTPSESTELGVVHVPSAPSAR